MELDTLFFLALGQCHSLYSVDPFLIQLIIDSKMSAMAEKTRFVDSETRQTFCIGGCLISGQPSNLPAFRASHFVSSENLPPTVDLRELMTKVEDQEQCYSCVGNALAGAYEFLIMKRSKKPVDVSRLFIYYNSRIEDGLREYNMEDRGTFIRSAITALKKFGCCKENAYPYDISHVNKKPPDHCYSEAKEYQITEAMSLDVNLNEMKTCLAEGYPFAFGLHVYQSFMKPGIRGRIPIPPSHFSAEDPSMGWHAMLAVGYINQLQCFIVRNSFGEKWGDKGYCYIPYDYICNPRYCQDLHAVKLVSDGSARRRDERDSREIRPVDRDTVVPVPQDILDDAFHYKDFWNFNDTLDQIHRRWQDRRAEHFAWNARHSHHMSAYHAKIISRKNHQPMRYILWIDKENSDARNVMSRLTGDHSVQIDFYDSLSEAEQHLTRNINKIQSSSTFQIVCRDEYQRENKNSFNLLEFLNRHRLSSTPVLIFCAGKSGVQHHLENQARSMNVHDWKQRLIVIDNTEELIRKCKENMNK